MATNPRMVLPLSLYGNDRKYSATQMRVYSKCKSENVSAPIFLGASNCATQCVVRKSVLWFLSEKSFGAFNVVTEKSIGACNVVTVENLIKRNCFRHDSISPLLALHWMTIETILGPPTGFLIVKRCSPNEGQRPVGPAVLQGWVKILELRFRNVGERERSSSQQIPIIHLHRGLFPKPATELHTFLISLSNY